MYLMFQLSFYTGSGSIWLLWKGSVKKLLWASQKQRDCRKRNRSFKRLSWYSVFRILDCFSTCIVYVTKYHPLQGSSLRSQCQNRTKVLPQATCLGNLVSDVFSCVTWWWRHIVISKVHACKRCHHLHPKDIKEMLRIFVHIWHNNSRCPLCTHIFFRSRINWRRN